jgi:probable HAF family extracellular repeat protein
MKYVVLLIVSGALLASSTASAESLPRYQVVDIGTLGGASALATSMNESGHVVGSSATGIPGGWIPRTHAFLWDGVEMRDLGTLGGPTSAATDINNSGQITGGSLPCDYDEEGGFWPCESTAFLSDGTTMVGHSGEFSDFSRSSVGLRINTSGQVLAQAQDEGGDYLAFVWDGETTIELRDPSLSFSTWAHDMNDDGWVVGEYLFPWPGQGFLWDGASMQSLDFLPSFIVSAGRMAGTTVPGEPGSSGITAVYWNGTVLHDFGTLGGTWSRPAGINEAGQVIVNSYLTAGDEGRRAFFWDGFTIQDMGTLGGASGWTWASAINNSGDVTGSSSGRAFLWDGESIKDLNSLILDTGPHLAIGRRINDAGQILVLTFTGEENTQYSNYVLTPISLLFSRLLENSKGVGPGKALESRVANAVAYYDAEDLDATCSMLDGLVRQVGTFSSQRKAKVTASEAEELTEDAKAIQAALGCS